MPTAVPPVTSWAKHCVGLASYAGTGCRESGRRIPGSLSAPRWRTPCGASRATAARPSSGRHWCRRSSKACSRRGCCARKTPPPTKPFRLADAAWEMRCRCLQALYYIATPGQLEPIGLVEVLTADALDHVDRDFEQVRPRKGGAYFYEPFLECSIPQNQLGVWYTLSDGQGTWSRLVDMVRDDLGSPMGWQQMNVYVDP